MDANNGEMIAPDFLALGLGGTNMMAMLWTVAMGRQAVGVEMRGDPFLGVHWNIREAFYHQLGLIDQMMDMFPRLRQRASRIVGEPGRAAVAAGVVREPHPIGPAHQAAGLQQLRGPKPCLAHQKSRAETEAAGELVRLGAVNAADLESRVADMDAVADLEIEPGQQGRIGGRAERPVTLGQQTGHRHFRLERKFAQHRVGAVDRLDFDQCQAAVGSARHAAQRRYAGDVTAGAEKRDFIWFGFALEQ